MARFISRFKVDCINFGGVEDKYFILESLIRNFRLPNKYKWSTRTSQSWVSTETEFPQRRRSFFCYKIFWRACPYHIPYSLWISVLVMHAVIAVLNLLANFFSIIQRVHANMEIYASIIIPRRMCQTWLLKEWKVMNLLSYFINPFQLVHSDVLAVLNVCFNFQEQVLLIMSSLRVFQVVFCMEKPLCMASLLCPLKTCLII